MRSKFPPSVQALHGQRVRLTGKPLFALLEPSMLSERVDHVWIRLEVPGLCRFHVVVNTFSRRNELAGFDSRIRVGCFRVDHDLPPPFGLEPIPAFDYAEAESEHNLFYEHLDREGMENLLIESTRSATVITAWGDLFCRDTVGIHQIHSCRKSCAVMEDRIGRDGGLTFYYAEPVHSVTFFFKFCGQP